MTSTLRILGYALLLCASLSPLGWAPQASAETTLDQLRKRGVVRLGFANETPFSYAAPDGTLAGVDYDVMKQVFEDLGIKKIEGVLTPFGSLIPGLKADRFDVIGTGLYIRPDRCKQAAFSEPTIVVGSAIIVPAGNPKKFHSFQDIAKASTAKLGYIVGGTQSNATAGGVQNDQFVSFPDVLTAVSALKASRVDAVLRTYIDAVQVVRQMADAAIEVAEPFAMPLKDGKPMVNYIGFAFRPDDKELVSAFNEKLEKFLGSAEHGKILEKYKIGQQAYPPPLKTAAICGG